jgi:glycine oxidase
MKIVIVGAGVAGLSIGWRLAQSGTEVVVLERAQPGQGATWASAGMIEPVTDDDVLAKFGGHSASLWPDFARQIEEQSGIAIGYRQDGALVIARSEDEAARLRVRGNLMSADDARAMEPLLADDIVGALFDAAQARVDNRALAYALTLAFARAGGTLLRNEAVIRFEIAQARAVAVLTPFARYEADAFVLAAGAWSGELAGLPAAALPPVMPVKGEMIALAPPPGMVLPKRVVGGSDVYLVPRGGRLLVGATVEEAGFDTSLTPRARAWLLDRAAALMPALAGWEIADHWAGLRPGTPDGRPILGATAVPNLFAATGQYRNGILFAPAIADALRSLILERHESAQLQAFDPKRFAPALV